MKRKDLSSFTKRLIRQNEEAIKIRKMLVENANHEIEELKNQNRELLGRN